jgi:hypothetical protein
MGMGDPIDHRRRVDADHDLSQRANGKLRETGCPQTPEEQRLVESHNRRRFH